MNVYVTCADCLKEGKERQPVDVYANDTPVASVQCAHCGKHIK